MKKWGLCEKSGGSFGTLKKVIIIADSNERRMKQNFPTPFLECPLRVSSQVGWIHAIALYDEGIAALREADVFGLFYADGGHGRG